MRKHRSLKKAYCVSGLLTMLSLGLLALANRYQILPGVGIQVTEAVSGRITLGTGWAVWNHWWPESLGDYRDHWTESQWESYFALLKESGTSWMRLDLYYGAAEPRNDNDNPEVINWGGFTFDSPQLKSLYRHLDFCQANNIDVYLVYSYHRCNDEYNRDRGSGWNSRLAVSGNFPELWQRPNGPMVDKRELAENLAATTYELLVNRGYTSIKQVALYVEPDSQWAEVDGFADTFFLGGLLRNLGIRDRIAILAPHLQYGVSQPIELRPGDFDVLALEDYSAQVDWSAPEKGLQYVHPGYRGLLQRVRESRPSMEIGMVEYGYLWTPDAAGPTQAYLANLSVACQVFDLYKSGFGGTVRWAFEAIYHPWQGFAQFRVDGAQYAARGPDIDDSGFDARNREVSRAMRSGGGFRKIPSNFEPQRMVATNLTRGSTIYGAATDDRGICSIASRNPAGALSVGLINLYPVSREVRLELPPLPKGSVLDIESYDETMPQEARKAQYSPGTDTLVFSVPARSINFLREAPRPRRIL